MTWTYTLTPARDVPGHVCTLWSPGRADARYGVWAPTASEALKRGEQWLRALDPTALLVARYDGPTAVKSKKKKATVA